MTTTHSTTGGRLARMRRYRRLMFGSALGGVGLSLVLRFLDYPVIGEVVYLLGILGFLLVWQGTSISLLDEREQEIERRASTLTLTVTAFGLIFAASGARLLTALTASTIPTWLHYTIYAFIAQFVLFAGAYAWFRYRP